MPSANGNLRLIAMQLIAGRQEVSLRAAREVEAAGQWNELTALALRWKILSSLETRTAALNVEIPEGIRKDISGYTSRTFVQSSLCIRSGITALSALERVGIPCLGFKGLATVGLLYGGPRNRMLQDVDVLVRPEDAERAVTVLESVGFKRSMEGSWQEYLAFVRASPGSAGNEAVSLTDAQGGAVDLHWRLGVVETEVLLANKRKIRIHNTEVPVTGAGHTMLLCVHHALRNDFVPDDIARDICDFSRWRAPLDETGEWPKIAADAGRWGLKEACQALDIVVNTLDGCPGRQTSLTGDAAELRGAKRLADLYFYQLDGQSLNTDLAYLTSLRPTQQILSGVSSGWKQYLVSMRRSEEINGELSLPLKTRLWRLMRSAVRLSPSQWRQVRALAKAKDRLSKTAGDPQVNPAD